MQFYCQQFPLQDPYAGRLTLPRNGTQGTLNSNHNYFMVLWQQFDTFDCNLADMDCKIPPLLKMRFWVVMVTSAQNIGKHVKHGL